MSAHTFSNIIFRLACRCESNGKHRQADVADTFLYKIGGHGSFYDQFLPPTAAPPAIEEKHPSEPDRPNPNKEEIADGESFAGTYLIREDYVSMLETEIAKANKGLARMQGQYIIQRRH